VFASSICQTGYGACKSRDDPKLYNTPQENKILSPETNFYTNLAQDCIKSRICVDLVYALGGPAQV
jgi:hypothetical protein